MNTTEDPAIAYVLRGKNRGEGVWVGLWSGTGKWLGVVALAHYLDTYSKTAPCLFVTNDPLMIQPPVERRQLALPLPTGRKE
jgi:hypothetical protein